MTKVKKAKKKKKKVGRPRMPKGQRRETKVLRLWKVTYQRLKKLKGKLTFDELIDEVLDVREQLRDAEKVFELDGQYYKGISLAEARGLSIQNAVKTGKKPTFPRILLDCGYDDGWTK